MLKDRITNFATLDVSGPGLFGRVGQFVLVSLAQEDSEHINDDGGVAFAIFDGVAESLAVVFELNAVDFRRLGIGRVHANGVAAGEERTGAGLWFLLAGDGTDATLGE
jgi:hypothetical protein